MDRRSLLCGLLCAGMLTGAATAANAVPIQETVPATELPLATRIGRWDTVTEVYTTQSDTMDLVQSAFLWASGAQAVLYSPAHLSEDYALGLKEDTTLTWTDCLAMASPEDSLCLVELTGTQLKSWIESCAARYQVSDSGTLSVVGDKEGIDVLYGVSYTLCLGDPVGSRVDELSCNGKSLLSQQTIQVAVPASRLDVTAQNDPYGWYAATGVDLTSQRVLWNSSTEEQTDSHPASGSLARLVSDYLSSQARNGLNAPKAKSLWRVLPYSRDYAATPVTRLQFVEWLYQCAQPDPATVKPTRFTDLPENSPAATWAVQSGIVQGNEAGAFLPDVLITREQAAVMLLRYDRSRDQGPSGAWAVSVPYADAAACSPWSAEAIMWNVIQSYLPADANDLFRPTQPLTNGDLWGVKLGRE